jgi:hypothetical protein
LNSDLAAPRSKSTSGRKQRATIKASLDLFDVCRTSSAANRRIRQHLKVVRARGIRWDFHRSVDHHFFESIILKVVIF